MEFTEQAPWLHNVSVVQAYPSTYYNFPLPPAPKKSKTGHEKAYLPMTQAKYRAVLWCALLEGVCVDVSRLVSHYLTDLELIQFSMLAPEKWGCIAEKMLFDRGNYLHRLQLEFNTIECKKCEAYFQIQSEQYVSDTEEDFLE